MKKVIFLFFILMIGCKNHSNKSNSFSDRNSVNSKEISEAYIKLCYGIKTKINKKNPMEVAMNLLNQSDYKGCLNALNGIKKGIDTVYWHSGFYALIIPDSNIKSFESAKLNYNSPINYLSFRYNDFMDDIAKDEEAILFQNSVDESSKDELFKLQTIEWGTLYDTLQTSDSAGASQVINYSLDLKQIYPDSKRLDYLIASSYFAMGDVTKALPIFENLILNEYYVLPILKKLISFYYKKNKVNDYNKYVSIFKRKFPNECLYFDINETSQLDSAIKACQKCITNGSQRDSIYACIYLAKYFLHRKLFAKVDSITNIYFEQSGKRISYDRLKMYEDEIYPDLKMRSLFLRRDYKPIKNYFFSSNIGPERELEFKRKVKSYYSEYVSKDTNTFNSFYLLNFQH